MTSVSFQLEKWPQYYPQCIPLWQRHYCEISRQDFALWQPDVSLYAALSEADRLQIVTARTTDGRLVGYQMTILQRHPHYVKRLGAWDDTVYLTPYFRRGSTGYRMIKFGVEALLARGVEMIFLHEKDYWTNGRGRGLGTIYKRLGFAPSDRVWLLKTGG